MTIANFLNFVGFQIGWFACILLAAAGYPGLGPLVVLLILAVNLFGSRHRSADLLFWGLVAPIGYLADSLLVLSGLLNFEPQAILGWPSTVWMVALWINFAAVLNASLGWLKRRYAMAAVLGAISGPLSYYAGAKLGAVQLPSPAALAAIGVEWLLALPLLLVVAAWCRGAFPAAPRVSTLSSGTKEAT